ncbi:hypothetical protein D7319_06400 [Streptomyces radicis]|uniref:Uncharacterized protein n=2 Tax=Streptomyces radicis TaxID=1750517 RepID=A0A3A9WPX7_9ACTN|nr:hypothetical protein D7319_06400 [Streptomyces radicis]RKN26428.1 hypothetical protein D7318_03260 [Streptomyces radicis]
MAAAAVESRGETLAVLASWSGVVAEGRAEPAPPREAGALAAFLLRRLDWLGGHRAAGEFAAEIAGVLARARHAAGPAVPVAELGPCVHPGCSGVLLPLPGGEAGCAAGHRWQPAQLLLLAHRLRLSA